MNYIPTNTTELYDRLKLHGGLTDGLSLKDNVLLCAITRNNRIIIPKGQDVIQVGDSVVVITSILGLKDINDILA